jgi:DNA mismatch endonuclease (patch repair protein)
VDRSANMRAIRSEGTDPEMEVRRRVHAMGYRYRLHSKKLPGKPDLVFAGRRKVVFVHGCFWHHHSDSHCPDGHMPRSNLGYWKEKLKRNVERDARNIALLESDGWDVMVIWECEIKDLARLTSRLSTFLG